jgi:hypothetical protein
MVKIIGKTKDCTICGTTKDTQEFAQHTMKCKTCLKRIKREYYLANGGKPTEQARTVRQERQDKMKLIKAEEATNKEQFKDLKVQSKITKDHMKELIELSKVLRVQQQESLDQRKDILKKKRELIQSYRCKVQQ